MLCLFSKNVIINAITRKGLEIMSEKNRDKNKENVNENVETTVKADAAEMQQTEEAAKVGEIEEIQEFVVASAKTRSERKQAERASISAVMAWSKEKKMAAILAAFALLALVYILLGIRLCHVPPVAVCVVLLVQTAIGVLLDQNPVWLHACVVAADIVVGICVGRTGLMVMAAVIYVAAILVLELLQRMGILGRATDSVL